MHEGSERSTAGGGVARRVVRGRRWIAAAWFLAAILLLPPGRHVEDHLVGAADVENTESARVEALLDTAFSASAGEFALLVLPDLDPTQEDGRRTVAAIASDVAEVDGVRRVVGPHADADTLLRGPDGKGAVLLAGLEPDAHPDSVMAELRRATASAIESQAPGAGHSASWTGDLPLWLDLRRFSAEDTRRSEARALPLTLFLLFVVFGSLVAALVPLSSGLLGIGFALGIAATLAGRVTLAVSLHSIVTILGLALGVDYALLLVRRFREARARGLEAEDAATEAVRWGGETLALSGGAVLAGFAGLAFVPIRELRSVALGGVIVVGLSVALATTLIPAILVFLGDRLEWGRIPILRAAGASEARWRRWSRFVTAHPWWVIALGTAPLIALALPAARLKLAVPAPDTLPAVEAVRGLHALDDMGRSGASLRLHVVLRLPDGVDVLSDSGWAAAARVSDDLARDARVGLVRSLPALARMRTLPGVPAPLMPAPLVRTLVADSLRSAFIDRAGRRTLLDVVPAPGLGPANAAALVEDLRRQDWEAVAGLGGAGVLVGGLPGANVDYEHLVVEWFPRVVALVLGATMLVLFVGFRSVLIPVKAIVLNLLSVAASFGVLVLLFQDGHGADWLGVTASPEGVLPVIPIIAFCTVFGISMDYEVFLMARIREERRSMDREEDAIAEGMARTAGLITGAAAIMVVVFGAFALGDFVSTQMLGVTLGVAVLVDATVVRLAVGPAVLALGGRLNWWPGERGRGGAR